MHTAANLAAAWTDRRDEAIATLQHAESAPGLFKPEHIDQLRDDVVRADKQRRFWVARAQEARGQ